MNVVNTFIAKIEDKVPVDYKVLLMDVGLQSTSIRWWSNHCNSLSRWDKVAATLKARFKEEEEPHFTKKHQGDSDPIKHLKKCEDQWKNARYLEELWVHKFINSLDLIPQAWYLIEERKIGTSTWQAVAKKFT